jgi:hypothetical protein
MRYPAMRRLTISKYLLVPAIAIILIPGLLHAEESISTVWDDMNWDTNGRWYSDISLTPSTGNNTTGNNTTGNNTTVDTGSSDNTQTVITLPSTNTNTTATLTSAASTTTQDTVGLYLSIGNSGKLPIGTIALRLDSVKPSVETQVKINLPQGVNVNRVFKYGATPDNTTAHWYDFTCDSRGNSLIKPCGEIIVEQGRKTAVLYLIDGQRGDDDLTVNGVIRDDVAFANLPEVVCMLRLLATGGADTWCTVTNASAGDSTMTFAVMGFEGADSNSTLPNMSITPSNSLRSGETSVYFFKGRNVYRGLDTNGTVVVKESDLASLPVTGAGFYAAKLIVAGSSVSTTNVSMACYQLNSYGAKRFLQISCY